MKKFIVLTVRRGDDGYDGDSEYCDLYTRGTNPATACYKWLLRAGLAPMEPGETRKVRIAVMEAK